LTDIRVVLVDDHALIREGLRRNLERHPGLEVVGEASTAAEARRVITQVATDVVVLDIRLTDGSGLDLCSEVTASQDAPAVVMLSMYGDSEHVLAARDAGAAAFVSKDAPVDDVIAAVTRASNGEVAPWPADINGAENSAVSSSLTPREREVLALLADGLSVSLVAKKLWISESTAKTHVAKIYMKLGASNRAGALMTAVRRGLISGNGQLE
jgi:DNA-binding NarL/FixJ family response regulator